MIRSFNELSSGRNPVGCQSFNLLFGDVGEFWLLGSLVKSSFSLPALEPSESLVSTLMPS